MNASRSWFPRNRALRTELQVAQKKCICFCLGLPTRGHTGPSHFRKINRLLVERRVELYTSTTENTGMEKGPYYLNDIFMPSLNNYNTRLEITLEMLLCRENNGQKIMSFLCPKISNILSSNIKAVATTASFTHSLKKEILEKLQQWEILLIFVDGRFFFFSREP